MNKSIFTIKDHVVYPETGKPTRNYSNKLLSQLCADEFADYVFDQCDLRYKPCWDTKHWLFQLEYLDEIPNTYARVYLYGVWIVLQEHLKATRKRRPQVNNILN